MISIVFTARTNPISRLIRWFTKGSVSHVFLEYDSATWGGRWAAEAFAIGFRKVPASVARQNVVAEFRCTFETDKAIKEMTGFAHSKFDWSGLFVFAWSIIVWRAFKKKIRKPMNNTDGMFCSELIGHFLQSANVLDKKKDPELISPQSLFEYCNSSRKRFTRL